MQRNMGTPMDVDSAEKKKKTRRGNKKPQAADEDREMDTSGDEAGGS